MKPTDALYYKYADVITSVVNAYAWNCPKDIQDELLLEAQLVFCKACLTYDPDHESGASFETWLRQKLQAITGIIKGAVRGPTMVKVPKTKERVNNSVITVSMLAQNISKLEDEDPVEISDAAPNWYLEEYGKQSDLGTYSGEFPKEMAVYIQSLKGDSLQIFQDFCMGRFSLKPQKFLTIAKKRAREVLNPNRLYRRVYMQEGWSLDRVKQAWKELSSVFKCYMTGQLPSVLTTLPQGMPEKELVKVADPSENIIAESPEEPSVINEAVEEPIEGAPAEIETIRQPRKESRCSVWYYGFEKRHGITYGIYRNLVRKGIIPRLKKGEDNLDLSMYRLGAC